jgi:Kef-type K+ transport system membrane component KefB
MNSPASAHSETFLLIVIIQLIVIILASRLAGALFRKLGQPQVCGEIAAGLILGPSFFGGFFPELFHRVFDPSVGGVFTIMSQIGLLLLMFLIGLEFDFSHLNDSRKLALSVSFAGILVPFALGFGLGWFMHSALQLTGSWINFSLFMATAMSITAIPVLGRIMIELNINRTRLGSITISAAAINDAAGWVILALVSSIAQSKFDPARFGGMIVGVIAFSALMMYVVRPRAVAWIRGSLARNNGSLSLDSLAALLIMILLSAVATNLIGIFSIFGAFVFGAILHDQADLVAAVRNTLQQFLTVFFLPIFFTYTGLRTDIGAMGGGLFWMFCGLVLLAAMVGKIGGCALAARWGGMSWRDSAIIGTMMNTRGLMELIVINMGYDLGIIPKSVFFMLVLMAVATTYTTAPVLKRLVRGSEIEHEFGLAGARV